MLKFPLKLVRDNIPERIRSLGGSCVTKPLLGKQYRDALLCKLVEEAKECCKTKNGAELTTELADLNEVIICVMSAFLIRPVEVDEVRKRKAELLGSFGKGTKLILTYGGK